MRTVALRSAALLAVFPLQGCADRPAPDWVDEGGYRWRELAVTTGDAVGFTLLPPARTGIDFINPSGDSRPLWSSHLGHGSGVALGDVDGDGLVDIYLTSIERSNALYRNLGGWRFEDVTEASGVAAENRPSSGAAFADLDGDRDLDLLATALGGPNSLFLNDGTGRFTDRADAYGLASDRASGTMTLADVDGDGDLDLYIANYKIGTAEEIFSAEELTFDRIVRQIHDRYEIAPEFREHFRVRTLPGFDMVAYMQRAEPDWFYLNDGTGRFQAVPLTSGRFLDENGNPYSEEPDYFGLAARFYDVDGDNDPDLFVCNDFDDPDLFWLNDGNGTFRATPPVALRATSNATMAVDFADIDRDGDVDFFSTDMLSKDSRRRKAQQPSYTALPKLVGQVENRPQTQRNTLFLNRGDATFAQIAEYAGVEASDWTWATMFLDVDLDGYEDILVTTGHLWDQFDEDNVGRMRRMPVDIDWTEQRRLFPPLNTPNVAFRNNGDMTFQEVSEEWGVAGEQDISHGLAAGDLDWDGDLDVVINRLGRPAAVLRNDATQPRVAVQLDGLAPNTRGVGAKIRVVGVAVPVQEREVTSGGMYLSSSTTQYAFAAGAAEELTIEVVWRSGKRSRIEGARPNRLYELREQAAADPQPPAQSAAEPVILFTDVTMDLNHAHTEDLYDDYQRQPLLLNKLSQLGPGVSWFDIDRDGDEDLVVPSGRSGQLALFLNDGDRLTRGRRVGPTATYDQTTALGFSDGPMTALLVGQALYEAPGLRASLSQPAVVSLEPTSSAVALVAQGSNNSTGPLALADVDGDQDLDLFVGGRVIPAAYPLPASSLMFRNEAETFVDDSKNSAELADVGMVSAAVFSDVDVDGDPDLLLALEWGPVKLLLNENGLLQDATDAWGLTGHASRWNGVTTGDLNGDGRPDIVATSWGNNTAHRASQARPLLLYYSDFDHNGSLDVIHAQYDDQIAGIVPLLDNRSDLVAAMPYTSRRVPSASAYADATVDEIIGPRFAEAARLEIGSMEHKMFLNRGDSFEAIPLPVEAQLAPAFYAGVADFDGDGNEDVFLSQNFFPTAMATPRYDAGRGLLLLGDGTGKLNAVPGHISGIQVYGDQRGAAFSDYNGDSRIDLAVSQNGAATKLYRNDAAVPGLRVRLIGPRANPDAVGATIRLAYGDSLGPAREVHAGSGYWSQDGAVQVMGSHGDATGVWVRWPGGEETQVTVDAGITEITIRMSRP